MDVMLLRHGKAEDADGVPSVASDAARRLTDDGRHELAVIARRIASWVDPVGLIAMSPLQRTRETAEVFARAGCGSVPPMVEQPLLAPGGNQQRLCDWLAHQKVGGTLVLVGHEPGLSHLASHLLAPGVAPFVIMKKAGACLIRFEGVARPGRGMLAWLIPPSVSRR